MRYRMLDANGDCSFGQGQANFYVDQVEGVAQAVATRLKLNLGEWFLDTTDGTPFDTQVLGKYTQASYDAAIQARILGTPGVTGITAYSSSFNGQTRTLTITATISTAYGSTTITVPI